MGALHYIQGNYGRAIESYKKALDITDQYHILFNTEIAFLANGNIDSANQTYVHAIRELGNEEEIRLGAPIDLAIFISRHQSQPLAEAAQEIMSIYEPKLSTK